MNRKGYTSDPRYSKVLDDMDLLGITDISTTRQSDNGTIVWRLPVRNSWRNGKLIEIASFKSGMVRNQNSAYSNYQLNKCKSVDRYYKDYNYDDNYNVQEWTGKYNKYTCKERILIPIEIDRLEYMLKYCVKNYFIKRANQVANGDFVPKWQVESQYKHNEAYNNGYAHGLEQGKDRCCQEVADFRTESEAKILILEKEIERITENNYLEPLKNLSVTVNGERYKII